MSKELEIKTFEIFTENFSRIIQDESINGAIVQFTFEYPMDRIIKINDVAFNSKQSQPPPKSAEEVDEIALKEYPKISSDPYSPNDDDNYYERLIYAEGIKKGLTLTQPKGEECEHEWKKHPSHPKMGAIICRKCYNVMA